MEGLIHGGKFACQNQLGQPYSWKEILHLRAISKPPGGLYLEGRFNRGVFALQVWGAYIWSGYTWRGLFLEFYGMFCTVDYILQ